MTITAVSLREQHQRYTENTAAYLAGEDVVPGDCWRTALACLLEIPRDDVPHFAYDYPKGNEWWHRSVSWVKQQRPGWTLSAWGPGNWPFYADHVSHDAPDRVLVTGGSPRGDWSHVVLVDARTGDLAWDPFPGGEGVLQPIVDRVALVREEWAHEASPST